MAEMSDIKKVLDQLALKMAGQKEWNRRGLAVIRIIKTRTRSWRDIKGRFFRGYSDLHRRRRVELGLAISPQGKNTDSLMVMDHLGGMMQKVDHIVSADMQSVVVDITDPVKKKIAYYHNVAGVAKRGENLFEFWGLNNKEERFLVGQDNARISELLAELTDDAEQGVL